MKVVVEKGVYEFKELNSYTISRGRKKTRCGFKSHRKERGECRHSDLLKKKERTEQSLTKRRRKEEFFSILGVNSRKGGGDS